MMCLFWHIGKLGQWVMIWAFLPLGPEGPCSPLSPLAPDSPLGPDKDIHDKDYEWKY